MGGRGKDMGTRFPNAQQRALVPNYARHIAQVRLYAKIFSKRRTTSRNLSGVKTQHFSTAVSVNPSTTSNPKRHASTLHHSSSALGICDALTPCAPQLLRWAWLTRLLCFSVEENLRFCSLPLAVTRRGQTTWLKLGSDATNLSRMCTSANS